MFIRYIFKNMRRSAVTNALFCLLLALAGALFSLSAGLWFSVYRTQRNLDDIITTIALPDVYAIRRQAGEIIKNRDFDGITTSWGTPLQEYADSYIIYPWDEDIFRATMLPYVESHIMDQIGEKVYDSGLLQMDDRRVYGGYAEGIDSVPLRITETGVNNVLIEQYPQFVAAFVVYCKSVDGVYAPIWSIHGQSLTRSFAADFKVEQNIYVHNGRYTTETVTGYFTMTNPDGSPPVEEGKRYVIMGYQYTQSGDMQTDNPVWYNALPPNRNMPNCLDMSGIGNNIEYVEAETIYEMNQFSSNILPFLMKNNITRDSLPMVIYDYIPRVDPVIGYEGYTWFELDGSLEDALESEAGDYIRAVLSVAEVSHNSLVVITTNDVNSFQRFNQRISKIIAGRAFLDDEIGRGARVCVISKQLAELNGLSVGDKLPLRMYATALGNLSAGGDSAWVPNPYHPRLELTGAEDYEIVGIYSGLTLEMRDHSISPNTVFIPASSFAGVDGVPESRIESSYDPPLLKTIIVPNEGIEEGKALIETAAEGCGAFFRFFDQGYSTLKPVLLSLFNSMTWITGIAAVGWVIAVVIFSVFYIGRKKRENALLSGLGVSKTRSFLWVYIQSAFVVILAQCIVLAVSVSFFGNILNAAVLATTEFTEGYRDFTLSDMNIAGGVRLTLPLETAPTGVMLAAAGTAALLLVSAAFFAARTASSSSLMKRELGD